MSGAYLGPSFDTHHARTELERAGATAHALSTDEVLQRTADALAGGQSVGWFQGRMEFGPRALGNRSILADPRRPEMQRRLNLQIKYRESFRPFAPIVLEEDVQDWFDLTEASPYMLLVAPVAEARRHILPPGTEVGLGSLNVMRSEIPAITHVDFSARVQTVSSATNPTAHALLSEFKKRTGCPVLVNTSFNVRGEPIVCTPQDAFTCFMRTDLDVLVVENNLLLKTDQDPTLLRPGSSDFALD